VKVKGGWSDLTRAQVLEIHCQECGAKPAERCHSKYGKERHEPHFLRQLDRRDGTDPGPSPSNLLNEQRTLRGPDGREWSWNQVVTWLISLTIRNELEMFHGGGAMDPENPEADEGFITDRQMKAMNFVIRHTVYEVLSRLSDPNGVVSDSDITNAQVLDFTLRYINEYMEPPGSPELEAAFEKIKNGQFDPPGFVPDCTRSEP
jgi:hypothetical protein